MIKSDRTDKDKEPKSRGKVRSLSTSKRPEGLLNKVISKFTQETSSSTPSQTPSKESTKAPERPTSSVPFPDTISRTNKSPNDNTNTNETTTTATTTENNETLENHVQDTHADSEGTPEQPRKVSSRSFKKSRSSSHDRDNKDIIISKSTTQTDQKLKDDSNADNNNHDDHDNDIDKPRSPTPEKHSRAVSRNSSRERDRDHVSRNTKEEGKDSDGVDSGKNTPRDDKKSIKHDNNHNNESDNDNEKPSPDGEKKTGKPHARNRSRTCDESTAQKLLSEGTYLLKMSILLFSILLL